MSINVNGRNVATGLNNFGPGVANARNTTRNAATGFDDMDGRGLLWCTFSAQPEPFVIQITP